ALHRSRSAKASRYTGLARLSLALLDKQKFTGAQKNLHVAAPRRDGQELFRIGLLARAGKNAGHHAVAAHLALFTIVRFRAVGFLVLVVLRALRVLRG